MRRLYPDDDELELTEAERLAAKRSASSQQNGASIGGVAGSVAGGALGALGLLVPGLGAVTIPAGLSLGGAAGAAIGGAVGSSDADAADELLRRKAEQRQKIVSEQQARQEALKALMAERR